MKTVVLVIICMIYPLLIKAESSGAKKGMISGNVIHSDVVNPADSLGTQQMSMAYICVENTDSVPYLTFMTNFPHEMPKNKDSREIQHLNDEIICRLFLRTHLDPPVFRSVGSLLYDANVVYGETPHIGINFFKVVEPSEKFYYIYTDIADEEELHDAILHTAMMPYKPESDHSFVRNVPMYKEPMIYTRRYWTPNE